jgi:hypothetical protein
MREGVRAVDEHLDPLLSRHRRDLRDRKDLSR